MKRFYLVFGAMLVAAGCSSGYKSFYQSVPGATPEAIAAKRANPPPAMPSIERIAPADPAVLGAAFNQRGYDVIGYSSFNSGARESEEGALKQGKAVGADVVVIVNPQYTGTVTTQMPLTTPTTSTSYTNATATAYGPAGTATAYGNATTTTYGSKTTYIPITVNRHDYTAVYLVKGTYKLGAYARDLNNEERQELQTNQGAVLYVIVDGQPAFQADLLPGDVVSRIGATQIPNAAAFTAATALYGGKTVDITFRRRGVEMTKQISINR
jgi:hypothetical protein